MGAAFTAEAVENCLPRIEAIFASRLDRLSDSSVPFSGWHESKAMSFELASRHLAGFDLDDGAFKHLEEQYQRVGNKNERVRVGWTVVRLN